MMIVDHRTEALGIPTGLLTDIGQEFIDRHANGYPAGPQLQELGNAVIEKAYGAVWGDHQQTVRHVFQGVGRIRARLGVDIGTGKSGAQNDGCHTRHGKCHRAQGGRIAIDHRVDQHWFDVKCRHPREMQDDDASRKQSRGKKTLGDAV